LVALDGNPKTAVPLAVVSRDTIDFFPQRTFNIRLEGVAEVGGLRTLLTVMNNSRT
jgi:hypothetical protein